MDMKSKIDTAANALAIACLSFALAGLIFGVTRFGWIGLAWWFGGVGVGYFGIFLSACRRIRGAREPRKSRNKDIARVARDLRATYYFPPGSPTSDEELVRQFLDALPKLPETLRERAKFREDS